VRVDRRRAQGRRAALIDVADRSQLDEDPRSGPEPRPGVPLMSWRGTSDTLIIGFGLDLRPTAGVGLRRGRSL